MSYVRHITVALHHRSATLMAPASAAILNTYELPIEIIDIEYVLAHESCLHFFSQGPF